MTARQQMSAWAAALAAALLLLWLLRAVMLPFVAGMAVAYFLDPLVRRLGRFGLSRAVAAAAITVTFFLLLASLIVLLAPAVYRQTIALLTRLPEYVTALWAKAQPLAERLLMGLDLGQAGGGMEAPVALGTKLVQIAGGLVVGLLGGGLALVNLLALAVITPVVAFFLLRDWDRLLVLCDGWLPRQHAGVIRAQLAEVDRVLAGFVRGQATVCLIMAGYYGLALTALGLESGLAIGLVAGFLGFIPYVGAVLGMGVAVVVAVIQFWPEYVLVVLVLTVFVLGQFVEGNFITPKLVGDRVGLHPLWIIFGLLAGGALFGFVGVLLAVPVMAVIGVMARFGLQRYLASRLFLGSGAGP